MAKRVEIIQVLDTPKQSEEYVEATLFTAGKAIKYKPKTFLINGDSLKGLQKFKPLPLLKPEQSRYASDGANTHAESSPPDLSNNVLHHVSTSDGDIHQSQLSQYPAMYHKAAIQHSEFRPAACPVYQDDIAKPCPVLHNLTSQELALHNTASNSSISSSYKYRQDRTENLGISNYAIAKELCSHYALSKIDEESSLSQSLDSSRDVNLSPKVRFYCGNNRKSRTITDKNPENSLKEIENKIQSQIKNLKKKRFESKESGIEGRADVLMTTQIKDMNDKITELQKDNKEKDGVIFFLTRRLEDMQDHVSSEQVPSDDSADNTALKTNMLPMKTSEKDLGNQNQSGFDIIHELEKFKASDKEKDAIILDLKIRLQESVMNNIYEKGLHELTKYEASHKEKDAIISDLKTSLQKSMENEMFENSSEAEDNLLKPQTSKASEGEGKIDHSERVENILKKDMCEISHADMMGKIKDLEDKIKKRNKINEEKDEIIISNMENTLQNMNYGMTGKVGTSLKEFELNDHDKDEIISDLEETMEKNNIGIRERIKYLQDEIEKYKKYKNEDEIKDKTMSDLKSTINTYCAGIGKKTEYLEEEMKKYKVIVNGKDQIISKLANAIREMKNSDKLNKENDKEYAAQTLHEIQAMQENEKSLLKLLKQLKLDNENQEKQVAHLKLHLAQLNTDNLEQEKLIIHLTSHIQEAESYIRSQKDPDNQELRQDLAMCKAMVAGLRNRLQGPCNRNRNI